jgi:hypothetical protein
VLKGMLIYAQVRIRGGFRETGVRCPTSLS